MCAYSGVHLLAALNFRFRLLKLFVSHLTSHLHDFVIRAVAVGSVMASGSKVTTSAGMYTEAAELITSNNELIFVGLPLTLRKGRK